MYYSHNLFKITVEIIIVLKLSTRQSNIITFQLVYFVQLLCLLLHHIHYHIYLVIFKIEILKVEFKY